MYEFAIETIVITIVNSNISHGIRNSLEIEIAYFD